MKRRLGMPILWMVIFLLFGGFIGAESASTEQSIDRFSNLRFLAMGSAGIALSETSGAFFTNPAALYRSDISQFKIGMRYGESLGQKGDAPNPIPWIQQPGASFDLLFHNRYVALSIGLGNVLIRDEDDSGGILPSDRESYTANNLSRIQLTGSYGWNSISLGFYASGGTMTERDVEIRQERPLLDYLSRTYLERYDPATDTGELFSSGIGILISYPWLSIGILSNSLFTIDEQTNQLVLDITDIFRGSAVGLAFTSPKFDANNELNLVVVNAMTDFVDLGDSDKRSVRMGVEAKVQFLDNLWVAIRGGYSEYRPVDESLFSLDGDGEVTTGIGGQVGDFGTDIVVAIPLDSQPVRLTAGVHWKL